MKHFYSIHAYASTASQLYNYTLNNGALARFHGRSIAVAVYLDPSHFRIRYQNGNLCGKGMEKSLNDFSSQATDDNLPTTISQHFCSQFLLVIHTGSDSHLNDSSWIREHGDRQGQLIVNSKSVDRRTLKIVDLACVGNGFPKVIIFVGCAAMRSR